MATKAVHLPLVSKQAFRLFAELKPVSRSKSVTEWTGAQWSKGTRYPCSVRSDCTIQVRQPRAPEEVVSVFAAALDALFTDLNIAATATFMPEGGSPVPNRSPSGSDSAPR